MAASGGVRSRGPRPAARSARPAVVFSAQDRHHLLEELIEAARKDGSVTAAALVGSMARDETDRWSDIDLALRLRPGADLLDVAATWTDLMHRLRPVADHLDVGAGPALYRVFLLRDSLQVDLSFWPHDAFGSNGEPFRLLFGTADDPVRTPAADPAELIGWAWLHALHARAAIARGRSWQALQMIDGLRDQLIALACLRHDLPPHQGRGVDRLPAPERAALLRTLPLGLGADALVQAFRAAVDLLTIEAGDAAGAPQLVDALTELRTSTRPPPTSAE